jgi:hypothetical protein
MKARDFGHDRKASRSQNTARFNCASAKQGNIGMVRVYLLEKWASSNDRFHVAFDGSITAPDYRLMPPEPAFTWWRGRSCAGSSSSRIRIQTGGSHVHVECECVLWISWILLGFWLYFCWSIEKWAREVWSLELPVENPNASALDID